MDPPQQLLEEVAKLAAKVAQKNTEIEKLRTQLARKMEFADFLQRQYAELITNAECPECHSRIHAAHSPEDLLQMFEDTRGREDVVQPAPKLKQKSKKKLVCSKCGQTGHSRRECPVILGTVG